MGMSESMDNMLQKPKTAEDIFRILREFMQESLVNDNYKEQKQVWDVLTALRGPDNIFMHLTKVATTAIIRGKLLGRNSSVHDMADMEFNDEQTFVDRRLGLSSSNEEHHFRRHVQRAFEALHLNWEGNNGKVDVQSV